MVIYYRNVVSDVNYEDMFEDAEIDITDIPTGTHVLTANYLQNEQYTSSTDVTTFTVQEASIQYPIEINANNDNLDDISTYFTTVGMGNYWVENGLIFSGTADWGDGVFFKDMILDFDSTYDYYFAVHLLDGGGRIGVFSVDHIEDPYPIISELTSLEVTTDGWYFIWMTHGDRIIIENEYGDSVEFVFDDSGFVWDNDYCLYLGWQTWDSDMAIDIIEVNKEER